MTKHVGFSNLQDALSFSDPLALVVIEHFPYVVEVVDQDMSLTSKVYRSISHAVSDVDQVRLALAAAGRLQGMALLVQSEVTYQKYSLLVEFFTRYLYDLDVYLRTLPRY